MLKYTCIKGYANTRTNESYVVIIHPLPDEFESMQADLNILGMSKNEIGIVKEAKQLGHKTVKLGYTEYSTDILSNDFEGVKVLHHIESYQRQKSRRDIIIKLVHQISDNVKYIVSISISEFCCIFKSNLTFKML